MRKRFANRRGEHYKQIRVEDEYLPCYAAYVRFDEVKTPKIIYNGFYPMCIMDTGYEWLMLYPDNGLFSITIIYDSNNTLIEWYFDVSSEVGLDNNIPYQNDLYLDMVILPDRSVTILDEDELLKARNDSLISDEDVNSAYKTLDYLKRKFADNIDELINFTDHIYDIMKIGEEDGSKKSLI